MKRLRVILLFLLLGAVVNVGVAWGIAWWGDSAVGMRGPSGRGLTIRSGSRLLPTPLGKIATHWGLHRIEKPGISLVVITAITDPAPNWEPIQNLLPPVSTLQQQLLDIESAFPTDAQFSDYPGLFYWDGRGWPMISMACYWPWFKYSVNPSFWAAPPIVGGFDFGSPTATLPWPYGVCNLRGIPYLPVWPGFIFNTLFYAITLWLFIPGPFVFHSMIRRRRGLCLKCGYDLQGVDHAICPECGTEVAKA